MTPKRIAATPRRTTAHHFTTRLIAMSVSFGAAALGGTLSVDRGLAFRTLRLAARGRALDLDPPAPLGKCGQGDRHLEHAVVEPRGGVIEVATLGEGNDAGETAVAAFRSVDALLLDVQLGLALALDHKGVIGCLDADVFGRQGGQVGADDELPVAPECLDRGRPDRREAATPEGALSHPRLRAEPTP